MRRFRVRGGRAGPRVAVVTGGSAGVGRAVVRELAAGGYDVAVLARGRAGAEGAAGDVRAAGRRALAVPVDVAEEQAVRHAADVVEEALGPIDLWVNAAFTGALAMSWDMGMDEFRRITDVTYYGQVHGTLAALERMRPRAAGVIVNVGSAMSFRSIPLQSAYCGAKHAVKGFSESVITELRHERSRVRLCMVQLPGLNTPQFSWNANRMPRNPMPVPPVFQPEAAARAVVFLARHPRRNAWVGVSTAWTILGERIAPLVMVAYLGRAGVDAQQTARDTPRWGANLFTPRDERVDRGAHGPFDDLAHARDPLGWVSRHRTAVLAGAAGLGAAAARGRRAPRPPQGPARRAADSISSAWTNAWGRLPRS